MEEARGFIEKILFSNEENGYKVLTVVDKDDPDSEAYLVGIMPYVNEGEFIIAKGNIVDHPKYGVQLQVLEYEIQQVTELKSIEKYLASGAIKGVGPAMAAKIVAKFGEDTFRVLEEEPELLVSIKGISERIARNIAEQVVSKYELRRATMFLQEYGISVNMAVKIYSQYGNKVYDILKKNPYKLAEDIEGIGFKKADEIAKIVGISKDSQFRIESAISYILMEAAQSGHTFLPEENLINCLTELLEGQILDIEAYLNNMIFDKKIVVKQFEKANIIYARNFFYMEQAVAKKLLGLDLKQTADAENVKKEISVIERLSEIKLDEIQVNAILETVKNGVTVITGGPGTGKTTTINSIIKYYDLQGQEVRLAAPTGRATKRMTETTGYEAQTIHRMLELNGPSGQFERNEENPIEADVIVIDEMSMVDIALMNSLLKAIEIGTKLILVGDVNQLPSVGPGSVLKDIISSKKFCVVELTKIFRQASESDIVTNAHKINRGERIDLDKQSKDFLRIKRNDPDSIAAAMLTLLREKLPKYVNAKVYDIQVLTPMKKGKMGVENLNRFFQSHLNPESSAKREMATANGLFREGDKVMQVKNDYNLEWETRSKYGITQTSGTGIFNGDVGIIKKINTFTETIEIEFDDGKFVDYPFKQLEDLELAYAITVHKAQGSEYPAVIIPAFAGPRPLMNRNLLYTAVTRAKQCVCLVGFEEVIYTMIENESEQKRYSSLDKRLMEIGMI